MFLFIFCPDGLSLGESGLLKPHTIRGLMITSVFNSRGVLYEIGRPRVWCIMLRIVIVMSSWLIVLFVIIKYLSLFCLSDSFSVKPVVRY